MAPGAARADSHLQRTERALLAQALREHVTESDRELAAASPARSAWLRWHASPAQLLPWCRSDLGGEVDQLADRESRPRRVCGDRPDAIVRRGAGDVHVSTASFRRYEDARHQAERPGSAEAKRGRPRSDPQPSPDPR